MFVLTLFLLAYADQKLSGVAGAFSSAPVHLGEFATVDLEKARRFFEVRFWGAVTAAKYAAKRIRSTGSIILTNGIIGLRPQKGWVIAAALSKRSPAHWRSTWLP